jgi:hypothetical protein
VKILAITAMLVMAAAAPAFGQTIPDPPFSMGQPARWRGAGGVMGGFAFDRGGAQYRGFLNLTPEGIAPNLGIDFISIEGAATYHPDSDEWGAEVGNYLRVPYLRLGIEYDFLDEAVEFVTSLQYGVRRGGLLHHGEELRIDYRGRNKELLFGIVLNTTFGRYRATRPFSKTTRLPFGKIPDPPDPIKHNGLSADLEESIGEIEHAVEWMDLLLTPRFFHDDIEEKANTYRDHIRLAGHTFVDEDARYHRELRRAFGLAVGDATVGEQLAIEAERIIYEDILVSYNTHFGEGKDPWEPTGYIAQATTAFDDVLADHGRFNLMTSDAAAGPRDLAREVFRRTVRAIDRAADASRNRWKTNKAFWTQKARLVWLPLNYGLLPEQYDTQAEWNRITEDMTQERFTDANSIEYMMNERFHPELMEMIHKTEEYHVLIIHDFTGWNPDGSPDPYGWDMVANGYMRAMIDAVRALDAGEREVMPQFLLFIDQNFYQSNGSRNIVTYMENIFEKEEADIDDGPVKSMVDSVHQELVDVVRASRTFGGMSDDELRELFKVHVTVTNRWDPTFAFDIDKRDHRKITFRDVFEDDPARGHGILTGTGVGHHYHPPGWEDRAMGIKGPALVSLKRTAEKLCRSQGYRDHEVPAYLLPREFPDDYEAQCKALRAKGWTSTNMVVFNDTGYGTKKATVQRAVMYNLAPKNSVLMAIDSLWLSDFWAGMFISAALRGAHVYAIAPSPANAPSSANFTMFLMQRNMELLIRSRQFIKEDLEKVNGRIRVGLYNHDFGVDDPVARATRFFTNVDDTPFVLEDLPMHPDIFVLYRQAIERWIQAAAEEEPQDKERHPVAPYLHMKTQFFATDVAMDILRQDEWVPIVKKYIETRGRQLMGLETQGMTPHVLVENIDQTAGRAQVLTDYEAWVQENRPGELDQAIVAFTIGSMNQDRRGMLSDGEVLTVCAGWSGLIGIMDLFSVAVSSAWPDTSEELGEYFPEPNVSTRTKRIARYLQDFF